MDRTMSARRRRWGAAIAPAVLLAVVALAGADGNPLAGLDLDNLSQQATNYARAAAAWYEKTPPADRITWGGLVAAAGLALSVMLERLVRLRGGRILPSEFTARFIDRLQDGELGRGKALDYCELNPSPASRVALAAVKRWGRPVTDLERAVSLAHRVEADRLRRNVGTLRRVAALTPLLGLLGTLFSISRSLSTLAPGAAWGPAIATALWPLTAGVAVATLCLVAYDGLVGKVEQLVGALDRVGAETVDAIALALPHDAPVRPVSSPAAVPPEPHRPAAPPSGPARTPHQVRLEVPKPRTGPVSRAPIDLDDDFD